MVYSLSLLVVPSQEQQPTLIATTSQQNIHSVLLSNMSFKNINLEGSEVSQNVIIAISFDSHPYFSSRTVSERFSVKMSIENILIDFSSLSIQATKYPHATRGNTSSISGEASSIGIRISVLNLTNPAAIFSTSSAPKIISLKNVNMNLSSSSSTSATNKNNNSTNNNMILLLNSSLPPNISLVMLDEFSPVSYNIEVDGCSILASSHSSS